MNIQLSHALSDVTGTTGLRIIRAIVAGERDPHTLAALRNYRCKKEGEEMALALSGPWRAEHLFVRGQALALFDCYTVQRSACDAQSEGAVSVIRPRFASARTAPSLPASPTPPRRKPHAHSKHAPEGNTRAHSLRITGVDLVAGHGMSDSLAQTI
jgi:hypothetical protein